MLKKSLLPIANLADAAALASHAFIFSPDIRDIDVLASRVFALIALAPLLFLAAVSCDANTAIGRRDFFGLFSVVSCFSRFGSFMCRVAALLEPICHGTNIVTSMSSSSLAPSCNF
jgi:hypothetical protein